jgi:plasmid maintenance system antidote protein VapI
MLQVSQTIGAAMSKVKRLLDAGASLVGAVRESIDGTFTDFAGRHAGVQRTALSAALSGWRPATDAMIAALVAELGDSPEEWRERFRDARLARDTQAQAGAA